MDRDDRDGQARGARRRRAARARAVRVTPRTIIEKIWDEHVVAEVWATGSRCCTSTASSCTSARARSCWRAWLRRAARPPIPGWCSGSSTTSWTRCPAASTARGPGPATEFVAAFRDAHGRAGIRLFDLDDPRQGIVHVISPEQGIALPGCTLVCPDSHTCTVGGIGALAWGIGSTEGEHAVATQTLVRRAPEADAACDFARPARSRRRREGHGARAHRHASARPAATGHAIEFARRGGARARRRGAPHPVQHGGRVRRVDRARRARRRRRSSGSPGDRSRRSGGALGRARRRTGAPRLRRRTRAGMRASTSTARRWRRR